MAETTDVNRNQFDHEYRSTKRPVWMVLGGKQLSARRTNTPSVAWIRRGGKGVEPTPIQKLTPHFKVSESRCMSIYRIVNKEGPMQRVNLDSVIEQAITKVTQNRIGDKPPVFVTLSPALTQVPWRDSALKQFLQFFLYESLLTSDANAAVEISLRRRSLLKDLTAFVGIQPFYWVQLRISGRGLKIVENHIEELFS